MSVVVLGNEEHFGVAHLQATAILEYECFVVLQFDAVHPRTVFVLPVVHLHTCDATGISQYFYLGMMATHLVVGGGYLNAGTRRTGLSSDGVHAIGQLIGLSRYLQEETGLGDIALSDNSLPTVAHRTTRGSLFFWLLLELHAQSGITVGTRHSDLWRIAGILHAQHRAAVRTLDFYFLHPCI